MLALSACINIPRWLEFEYAFNVRTINMTNKETGETTFFNESILEVEATPLRHSNDYIRDYTLISATVLIVILPTLIMLVR